MATKSFIEYADNSDFPIQNLPYGVFRREGGSPRVGVAIGSYVLDLRVIAEAGLFDGPLMKEKAVEVFSKVFFCLF